MFSNNVTNAVSINTTTDGCGLWSNKVADVAVNKLELGYCNEEKDFGELRACFDPTQWNINVDGLIYTDEAWISAFKAGLVVNGFSPEAADDVGYSEQGMQGDSYVSLDIGGVFIKEWEKKYGEIQFEDDGE